MSDIKLSPPNLPPVPQASGQRAHDAIKAVIETMRGARGNPLDRAVFVRDLVDTGLLSMRGGRIAPGSVVVDDSPTPPDLSTPPLLANLVASAGFSHVLLTWNDPHMSNLAYYEVWRKTLATPFDEDKDTDPALLMITPAEQTDLYALYLVPDPTEPQLRLTTALELLETASLAYDENDSETLTSLQSSRLLVQAAYADDALTATRIAVTVGPMYSDPVDRGRSYLYWVRAVSTAGIAGPFNANGVLATTQPDIAAIMRELTASINNTLIREFIFDGIDMTGYAGFGDAVTLGGAIVQQQAWLDTLNAGWGVRIELTTDDKPYAVGFGLNVDASDPNDPESTFLVVADRFAVMDPDDVDSTNAIAPFIVAEDPNEEGVMKVWINSAMINRAVITDLLAGHVVADYVKIHSGLVAPHINLATINIGTWTLVDEDDPTSWTYDASPGRQGNFSVDESGIMHATYAVLQGIIVKDVNGDTVLDTYNNTYENALVSGSNPINSSNVGTFISNLAVNTLQIAGGAITSPAFATFSGSYAIPASYGSVVSTTLTIPETGLASVDEDVPVAVFWAAETDAENSGANARSFRLRQLASTGNSTIYESFALSREIDQYNSGVVKTAINAGVTYTWQLEVRDSSSGNNVYQASLFVMAVRR